MSQGFSEYTTMDESIANLIQQLGEGKPKVLSHLSDQEHGALVVASAYNLWAKNDLIEKFVEMFLTLAPSRGGRSRKQLTSIGIASMGPPPAEEGGLLSRFRRRLSRGGD